MSNRRRFLKQAGGLGALASVWSGVAGPALGVCPPAPARPNKISSGLSAAETPPKSPVLLKAPALRSGDLVAIVSPGMAISLAHPMAHFEFSVAALEREGFKVKVMPHARGRDADGKAGSVEERAADLNAAFEDPEVRMVMGAEGGGGTVELVSGNTLNWEALRRHPKLLCGYSDFTFLNVAAYLRLGLVTLDGPLIVYYWGCQPEPPKFAIDCFRRVAMRAETVGVLKPPKMFSVNPFEFSDAEDRAKKLRPAPAWRCLRPGSARGPLLAVRPDQVLDLKIAGYDISLAGHIWVVDVLTGGDEFTLAMHGVQAGGFLRGVRGIVTSRIMAYHSLTPPTFEETDDAVVEATKGLDVPILAGVDCGHTIPRLTIPNGVMATLDSARGLFQIDGSAVAP